MDLCSCGIVYVYIVELWSLYICAFVYLSNCGVVDSWSYGCVYFYICIVVEL